MLLLDGMEMYMKTTNAVFGVLAITLGLFATEAFTSTAHGQIFVLSTPGQTNVIGEYTTSGETVNASLIQCSVSHATPGLSGGGLAYDGNGHLLVRNADGIGEYMTSGAPVNTSLISSLNGASSVAVDDEYLFVAYSPFEGSAVIGEYTTSGAPVNAKLISGDGGSGVGYDLKSDGNGHLFTVNEYGGITEYATSGATLYFSLVTSSGPTFATALAVDGNGYLYVATTLAYTNFTIAKYTTSGELVNASLISGPTNAVADMALDGNGSLFLLGGYSGSGGTVAQYTTSGQVVNASLISEFQGAPTSIIVVPPLQPPQGPQPKASLIKAVKPSFSNLFLGTNYQLQVSTDLNTWTNHASPFTPTNTVMDYPQYFDVDNWGQLFFRLQVSP